MIQREDYKMEDGLSLLTLIIKGQLISVNLILSTYIELQITCSKCAVRATLKSGVLNKRAGFYIKSGF